MFISAFEELKFTCYVFFVIFFSFNINTTVAQVTDEGRFLSNDLNDKLPHSDVTSLLQDQYGFMWFGTYNGLGKYDGGNLEVFRNDINQTVSLSNSRVLCLRELRDGSILIGTESGGLNQYFSISNEVRFYKHIEGNEQSISGDVVNTIYQANDGTVWVGTNEGLDQMVCENDTAYFVNVQETTVGAGVGAIVELNRREILFSSETSLYKLDNNKQVIKLKLSFDSVIKTLLPLGDGRFLVGCENGLYVCNDSIIKKIYDYPILSSCMSNDSTIWIGTIGYGLLKIDKQLQLKHQYLANKSDPQSLTFDEVSSLYEDHSGVLWVGTYGGGINKLDLRAKKFELYTNSPWKSNSLSDDRVISFFEDSENLIWIGLRGGGINILDRQTGRVRRLSDNPGDPFYGQNVASFYQDVNGHLWIGTWGGGIFTLSQKNIRQLLEGNNFDYNTLISGYSVEKIIEDYEGHIWLSTTSGLLEYIPDQEDYYNGSIKKYLNDQYNENSLTDNFIRDVFIEKSSRDGNKVVWVGTRNGLNRMSFEKRGVKVRRIFSDSNDSTSLPSNFISVVLEDGEGNLWVSALGGGIAKLTSGRDGDSEPSFRVINKSHGLPNNEIETILEDDSGNFWMGGYGLTRYDPKSGELAGFDVNDGLQSNSFKVWSAFRTQNGDMIFGGTNGFNVFDPSEIHINEILPKLALTKIEVNNKEVEVMKPIEGRVVLDSSILVTRHIELPYNLNSFTLYFSALHFTSPENNHLKFKLEGVDPDWVNIVGSQGSRNYSNIKPGVYKFILTGSNSDNVWSVKPLEVIFVIEKPFWATVYAFILYIVVIVVLLLIFRKYSIIQVKEMSQLKLDRMRRDQIEEVTRLKFNFYTDVSHELRTPLTLIAGPVDDILESNPLNAGLRRKLDIVKKNVNRLTLLVDQIMDFTQYDKDIAKLKAAQGDIIQFVKEILLFFNAEASGRHIDIRFLCEETECLLYFDRDRLEMLFFNLLSNAFKFTNNGGIIEIKFEKEAQKGRARFSIYNTGKNISQEDLDHIFDRFYTNKESNAKGAGIGLSVAKQIIELHKGSIRVDNLPDGVCFSFELPLGKDSLRPEYVLTENVSSEDINNYFDSDEDQKDPEVGDSANKKRTVLIVEDNKDICEYIVNALSKNFRTIVAHNGEQGLRIASNKYPDVVISDMMMPEMDGLTLCSRLKSDVNTSHIPIIILTARTSIIQQVGSYEAGADAFITKPFNTKLLLARVKNLIESRENHKKIINENLIWTPSEITVTSLDEKLLTETFEVIEKNLSNSEFGVDQLCQEIGMSRSQLYRKIKALTSYSLNVLIRLIRLKRAAQLLSQDNSSVSEVMRTVGFENHSYFSRAFKDQFNVSPKQYKERI